MMPASQRSVPMLLEGPLRNLEILWARPLDLCLLLSLKPKHRLRKRFVTDRSGPQRHASSGWPGGESVLLRRERVEGQVQLEDVDAGFAEEIEEALGGVILNELIDDG